MVQRKTPLLLDKHLHFSPIRSHHQHHFSFTLLRTYNMYMINICRINAAAAAILSLQLKRPAELIIGLSDYIIVSVWRWRPEFICILSGPTTTTTTADDDLTCILSSSNRMALRRWVGALLGEWMCGRRHIIREY